MIQVHGLTKRFGRKVAVANLSFDVQPGSRHRLPRSERIGQEHHDAVHARPRPGRHRRRAVRRQAVRRRSPKPLHEVGALLDAGYVHPGPIRSQPPAVDGGVERVAEEAGRRGARDRRALVGRHQALAHLLARHAPAAGAGRCAAGRAAHDHPRRAGQRPRPRGHPLDPRRAGAPGRTGQDRAGQQPPAQRDGAHGHVARRHRAGPADRAVLGRRLRRSLRRPLGEGAQPCAWPTWSSRFGRAAPW